MAGLGTGIQDQGGYGLRNYPQGMRRRGAGDIKGKGIARTIGKIEERKMIRISLRERYADSSVLWLYFVRIFYLT